MSIVENPQEWVIDLMIVWFKTLKSLFFAFQQFLNAGFANVHIVSF